MPEMEIWANLPVKDVETTRKFFTTLGFKPAGMGSKDLVAFTFSEGKFVICFFQDSVFAKSAGQPAADTSKGSEILFSIGANSREEVDGWPEKVREAGGAIYLEPTEIPQGYNFAFADPDGHRFNVFFMEQK